MVKKNLSYPASLLYRLLNGYDKYMRWIDRKPTPSQKSENEKAIINFTEKHIEMTNVLSNTIKYVLVEKYKHQDLYDILKCRYEDKKTLKELSIQYGKTIEAIRQKELKGLRILNQDLVRQLFIPVIWNDPRSYMVEDDWIQIYETNENYSEVYKNMIKYELDYVLQSILNVQNKKEFLEKCENYHEREEQQYYKWVK